MARSSTRTLWKGAITFGLVHIPIGLYAATAETGVGFEWLDRRSMDRVGYKRINKTTGEEIASEDIVKGVKWHGDQYVVLSPEEVQQAYPRTTQTIEIEAFVDADEVPFMYLERPYYVAPIQRGDKVYALLREALRQTHKAGIARVVIQTKQHLALVVPCGPALVLNLLRWGGEIRSFKELHLPPSDAQAAGVKPAELDMARQLIEGMSGHWNAEQFRDTFSEEIMKLVEAKAEAGQVAQVGQLEPAPPPSTSAQVVDLTELLRRSLKGPQAGAAPTPGPAPRARAASRAGGPAKERATDKAAASSDESTEDTAAKATKRSASKATAKTTDKPQGRTQAKTQGKTQATPPEAGPRKPTGKREDNSAVPARARRSA